MVEGASIPAPAGVDPKAAPIRVAVRTVMVPAVADHRAEAPPVVDTHSDPTIQSIQEARTRSTTGDTIRGAALMAGTSAPVRVVAGIRAAQARAAGIAAVRRAAGPPISETHVTCVAR